MCVPMYAHYYTKVEPLLSELMEFVCVQLGQSQILFIQKGAVWLRGKGLVLCRGSPTKSRPVDVLSLAVSHTGCLSQQEVVSISPDVFCTSSLRLAGS